MDQHARLGVLRGQVIAVDGHPPSLVPQQVDIAVQAAGQRGELGAQEKDVDAAERRRLVQEICHRLLEDAFGEVGNQMAVDDHGRTTLFGEVSLSGAQRTREAGIAKVWKNHAPMRAVCG